MIRSDDSFTCDVSLSSTAARHKRLFRVIYQLVMRSMSIMHDGKDWQDIMGSILDISSEASRRCSGAEVVRVC